MGMSVTLDNQYHLLYQNTSGETGDVNKARWTIWLEISCETERQNFAVKKLNETLSYVCKPKKRNAAHSILIYCIINYLKNILQCLKYAGLCH